MNLKYRSFLTYAIPLFISLAVCTIAFQQVKQVALSHADNSTAFSSYSAGFEHYKQLRQEWRPRILTNFLAGRFINLFNPGPGTSGRSEVMKTAIAAWTVAWLFLSFLLLTIVLKEKALLYIFGIFAGISFAYTPGMGTMRVYPWDMPALFVFCCFVVLHKSKHDPWLVAFIPIAVLFKETAIVLVTALLFMEGFSLRRRLLYTGVTLAAALALKTGVDLLTANPSPLFSMTLRRTDLLYMTSYLHMPLTNNFTFETSLLAANLREIFSLRLDSPFFIDAGLLVALFLLPIKRKPLAMLKGIALAFTLGILLFGVISEYRIWFELIPVALYALEVTYFTTGIAKRIASALP